MSGIAFIVAILVILIAAFFRFIEILSWYEWHGILLAIVIAWFTISYFI